MERCFIQWPKHSKAGDSEDDIWVDRCDHLDSLAMLRRHRIMSSALVEMKNAMNINDWVRLQRSFHKLNKQLGQKAPPTIYLAALVFLGDFLKQAHLANIKEAKNRMNSSDPNALKVMKLKLKKKNNHYKDEIKKFRDNLKSEDGVNIDLYFMKPGRCSSFLSRECTGLL